MKNNRLIIWIIAAVLLLGGAAGSHTAKSASGGNQMTAHLHELLELALVRLEAGEKLDDILVDYPEHAAQLRPVLQTAEIAGQDPLIKAPSQVISRSRTRVLAHAAHLRQADQPGRMSWGRAQRLAVALVIALAFMLSWGGLIAASAQALPGDQLYPAKLTLEKVRLGLTFSPQSHQQVEALYQSRRVDEVQRLLTLGRVVLVEFHGVVEQQKMAEWVVSSIPVRLSPTTVMIGQILPGMTVEVEGLTQPDGVVNASEIHLQTFGFVGYVEAIGSQSWQIDGRSVQITAESRISPGIKVGDWVVASVRSDDFGNLTALIISGSTLPTPTPTPLPTATAVPTTETQELPDVVDRDDSEEAQEEQESSHNGDEDELDEANSQEDSDEDGRDESGQEDDTHDEREEDDEEEQDEEKEEDKDDD